MPKRHADLLIPWPINSYSFLDPTAEDFAEAAHTARYGAPTRAQLYLLAECAESLSHILTHPAGTESVVKQVRELRRAIAGREIDAAK